MKFLVAGLGSIGQRHLQNLGAMGNHEFLAYRTRGNALPDTPLFNGIKIVQSIGEGLSYAPDATLVCGPTGSHLSIAVQAARAGSNLFIEKPISDSVDGIAELIQLASRKQLVTFVGLNMRFHRPLQVLRQAVIDGKIGRMLGIRCQVGQYLPAWHPGEDYRLGYSARKSLGGGVVLDLIHEIDLVIWIAGLPSEVAGFTARVSELEIDTEDTAEIILRMPGNLLANVHMDYVQNPASRSLLIYGEDGSIEWNGVTDEVILSPAAGEVVHLWKSKEDRNRSYVDMMNSFLDSLAGDAASVVPLEEGLKSQVVADAVHRSNQSGRAVALSW